MENPEPTHSLVQLYLRSPKWLGGDATTEMPLSVRECEREVNVFSDSAELAEGWRISQFGKSQRILCGTNRAATRFMLARMCLLAATALP